MIAARVAATALLVAFAAGVPAAGPRTALTVDPFRKPDLETPIKIEPLPLAEVVVPEAPALPRLRAILHSERSTLVNLDGELIELGGRYQGYRVAAASARDVVLLADDETFVVSIDAERKDDVGR